MQLVSRVFSCRQLKYFLKYESTHRKFSVFKMDYFKSYSTSRGKPELQFRAESFTGVMKNLLKDREDLNWKHMKNCLIEDESLGISKVFVNHVIFSYLLQSNKFEEAQSFCRYIIDNSESEMNLAAASDIFHLYYEIGKSRELTAEEKLLVGDLYQKLRNDHGMLDPRTNSNAVGALCHLNDWQRCLDAMQEIKLVELPSRLVYTATVDALFRSGQSDKGWEVMNEMLSNGRIPTTSNYSSWLDYCVKSDCTNKVEKAKKMEVLLHFISRNDLKIDSVTAEIIQNVFTDALQWKVDEVKVDIRGVCSECSQTLKNDPLSVEEFDVLKKNFMEHALIGKSVFRKTTPQELEDFLKYLARAPKYNMVLDSLNIVIPANNIESKGMVMLYLLNRLRDLKKRVFILGRKHLLRLPHFTEWKRKSAAYYMIQNLSDDDTFLLYAAMMGGPHTDFMSCDMMRGHTFRMKTDSSHLLFLRWQRQHQHQLIHCSSHRVIIKYPMPYAPIAQKDIGWHIPFEDEVAINHNPKTELLTVTPKRWLCMTPPLRWSRT